VLLVDFIKQVLSEENMKKLLLIALILVAGLISIAPAADTPPQQIKIAV
jgi:hypothetical protein